MEFKLSIEEFKALRKIQKKPSLHPRRYKKVTVLIMLHQQHSVSVIEAALGLDDNTIRRYVKGYQDRGLKKYLESGYIPYCGRLSDAQELILSSHLEEFMYLKAEQICQYVAAEFGITYTVSGMTALLHKLGFVYKQAKKIPAKADDEAQIDFLQQTLDGLLKEAQNGQAVVYFTDGCHPTHNTKTSRGWIKKGQDFEIDCNSGRKRVNINGAINALKPEHLVYDIAKSINAQSTKRLCQQLLKKHPRKQIYLICDNARYYKNKMLRNWVSDKRIEFKFLPAYSPNLNLIERLWRLMKAKAINSTYYETYEQFKVGIECFLKNTKKIKSQIRQLLTLNFRTVDGNSFYAHTSLR